jgi:hypothetical protein
MPPGDYETGLIGPWEGTPGESRPACLLQGSRVENLNQFFLQL